MDKKHLKKTMHNSKWSLVLFLLLISFIGGAFTHTVKGGNNKYVVSQGNIVAKGMVVDEIGLPIIGASVVEKGTTNGAITDLEGNFILNINLDAIVVITYVGYETQELKASAQMNIALAENRQLLDELVVIGYGVQKKKLVTGATVQIKGDDLAKQNTVTAIEALQSQAPGVNITQSSGFIGSAFKVNIRGIGTTGSSGPLVVIDGVAAASMDGLNPNDIESIDILKDAAAGIYGARAANGVILITTKQGKVGTTQISYDAYYGWQNIYKMPSPLTGQEYMMIQDEMRVMDGYQPYNWDSYLPANDLAAIRNGSWKGTNWVKESMNNDAPIQNHSLNFSGGADKSKFSIGISYTNQEATIGVPNAMPSLDRYNGRINTNHTMIKKGDLEILKIGQTLNYKYQEQQGSMGIGDIYWNSMKNLLIMSPLTHAYRDDGEYYVYADQIADGYNWDMSSNANKNPIAYTDYHMNQNKSKSHYLQTSIYAVIQPIKGLNIRTQFGYIMSASSYRSYLPAYGELTQYLNQAQDLVAQTSSSNNRWSWENTANYKFSIGKNNFDALLGMSLEKWGMGESISASNRNSMFHDFDHAYLSNVPGLSTVSALTGSPIGEGRLASFFARAMYDYDEKYMASVTFRADGSSTFAKGNRWGYFPTVTAGWTITNEEFMNEVNWMDFLKLRASWGGNGNQDVAKYQHIATLITSATNGGYPFGGSMGDAGTGSYPERIINPDLKWETQRQTNIGVDSRFLRSRLGVTLDWYYRKTEDWLVTPPILLSVGTGAVVKNGGDVTNQGLEVAANWNDNYKDFSYGANLSLGHNKNKVVKIDNSEGKIPGVTGLLWWQQEPAYYAEVGKPMGYFYGYKSDGIFQNQEQIDNYKGALLNGSDTRPGDVIWSDVKEDGIIDQNDRTDIGNPHPDLTLGLSLNVAWKGLDLSVTTYGAFGHQILKCYRDFVASPLNNYTTDVFERWHGEGTSNKMPRLTSGASSNWNRVSDILIEDADYLKFKNITVGYDFKQLFKNLPMQQLRIYFAAQNLFTITAYSGMDPEVGYGGGDSWASGIDLGFYPSARTFMLGTNIKF